MIETLKERGRKERPAWIVAILLSGFAMGWLWFWEASRFYSLDEVVVYDAEAGTPNRMDVDRTVHIAFHGEYTVTIRSVERMETVCSGGSRVHYSTDANLPEDLNIAWWAAGAVPNCVQAMMEKPGRFIMRTCVEVRHPLPFTPRGNVCRYSNIFEVFNGG